MRILIVDDDPNALLLASAAVSEGGYEVLEASSGNEALEIVGKLKPDLVLLDVALPDMSGFEVCRRIKSDPAAKGSLVVLRAEIGTTGHAETKGLGQGADGFIVKAIPDSELLARLQSILRIGEAEELVGQAREEPGEGVGPRTAEMSAADEQLRVEAHLRKRAEEALQRQVQFERLMTDIAVGFANLPFEAIENQIEDSQRRVCELLDIDRGTVWLAQEGEPGTLLLTYFHESSAADRPLPREMRADDQLLPWTLRKLTNGETLIVSRMEDFPPEAARDREVFESFGVRSSLTIPIFLEETRFFGALSFGMIRYERDWSEIDLQRLKLLGTVFANALERRRTARLLREGEVRLGLVMEVAGTGLWSMDLKTGRVWVTPRIRELFRLAPAEEIVFASFLKIVHPEDRKLLEKGVEEAQRPGGQLWVECRVESPDGGTRWIHSQGRVSLGPDGEPAHLMAVSLDVTEKKRSEEQLRKRLVEIEALKQRLERENVFLAEEIKLAVPHDMVGHSAPMKRLLLQAEQVAPTDSTVLIMGETGTGKELLARAIHRMSKRSGRPLVTVNCASLPPSLIEGELFGREKGAYTGAMTKMIGRFEVADGSTLFLDEIGELSSELQNKLLRVLEDGVFERLGSTRPIRVNVRLIAATNRDLEEDVRSGRFRKDLYFRLNVFPVTLPPLRERSEDVPLLVWTFVNEFQKRMGKRIEAVSRKSMEAMQHYAWPGNVRELRNVVERAMITVAGPTLHIPSPGVSAPAGMAADQRLEEVERHHILNILERTYWRVTGKGSAAEILGLKRSTLQSKMKRLGIKRPAHNRDVG